MKVVGPFHLLLVKLVDDTVVEEVVRMGDGVESGVP